MIAACLRVIKCLLFNHIDPAVINLYLGLENQLQSWYTALQKNDRVEYNSVQSCKAVPLSSAISSTEMISSEERGEKFERGGLYTPHVQFLCFLFRPLEPLTGRE